MNRDHVDWGLILRTFSTLLGQCSSSEENLQQLESLQFKKVVYYFINLLHHLVERTTLNI